MYLEVLYILEDLYNRLHRRILEGLCLLDLGNLGYLEHHLGLYLGNLEDLDILEVLEHLYLLVENLEYLYFPEVHCILRVMLLKDLDYLVGLDLLVLLDNLGGLEDLG